MTHSSSTDLVDLLDCSIVDLYVGEKRKKFPVHQKLICKRSTFFDKALNGSFKEGTDGAVYFPDDDPAVVEVFITWLYSGTLNSPLTKSSDTAESSQAEEDRGSDIIDDDSTDGSDADINDRSDGSSDSDHNKEIDSSKEQDDQLFSTNIHLYTSLYCFAEKYGVESLQNQSIDKLQAIMPGRCHCSSEVRKIYDNTTMSSPLRRFATRYIACYISMQPKLGADFISAYCEVGGDFVKDLLKRFCGVKFRQIKPVPRSRTCFYHVHSDRKRCRTR